MQAPNVGRTTLEEQALAALCAHPRLFDSAGLDARHFRAEPTARFFAELERQQHEEPLAPIAVATAAGLPPLYGGDRVYAHFGAVASEEQAADVLRRLRQHRATEVAVDALALAVKRARQAAYPLETLAAELLGIQRDHLASVENLTRRTLAESRESGLANLEAALEGDDRIPWLEPSIPEIAGRIGPYQPGDLILLVGEAASGKSTLAVQEALAAAEHGQVLFFSCEMSEAQVGERIARREMFVGLGERYDRAQIAEARGRIERAGRRDIARRILMDYRPRLTLAEVLARGVEAQGRGGLALVVFDHARKWEPTGQIRTEEAAAAAPILEAKLAARTLGVPLMMLIHPSRARRDAAKPTNWMIRGSGRIEDEADTILFLWPVVDDNGQPSPLTELHCTKRRQGGNRGMGPVPLKFIPRAQALEYAG